MSSMSYFFQHDTTTGVIYPYLQSDAPASSTTIEVLGPYPQDTATPDIVAAYTYSNRYQVQNGAIVPKPYFTLASTTAAGQMTITATINNPSATPPADCTFQVLGQTFTETVTNNVATLTVNIHPSVSDEAFLVSVSADGVSSASLSAGGSLAKIGLQVYTPPGGVPNVAPSGTGSRDFLQAYYAVSPATMTKLIGDIATSLSLLMDLTFNVLLPAAQQQNYTPVTFTADQQNTLSDMQANVLKNLYTTLANGFPVGKSKQLQYDDFATDWTKSYQAFENYATDLANIPNLA